MKCIAVFLKVILMDNNKNPPKRDISMADIAKRANVSKTTVSRALNHENLVSPATRRRILKVIDEMNYSPNDLARTLKTDSSRTIGIIVPNLVNTFFSELILSAEDTASQAQYATFLCNTNLDQKKEAFYLNELMKRRVDGLIVVGTELSDDRLLKLARRRMKLVSIQADIDYCDRIDVTAEKGTREIVEHLIENNHRKIAFLGYRFDLKSNRSRLEGYKNALAGNGIEIREDYICQLEHTSDVGYDGAERLLSLPEPPTAIHCMNDVIALGVYRYAHARGLKIPDDISVTGFDNISLVELTIPRLTTVQQPIQEMGSIAASLLLEQMQAPADKTYVPREIVLPTTLIKGASVKKLL